MILEVLYFATAISMGMQQESFEEQDEHERQYEYESRYYAKPEDKRSAVGKFMFLKVKGEIRNDDNTLDPFLASVLPGGHKSLPDIGFPFPISFPPHPFLPPVGFPHVQHALPHPVSPDTVFFDRPHGFFEAEANGGGQLVAMAKMFGGFSFPRRPDFPLGSMDPQHGPAPFFHQEVPSSRLSNADQSVPINWNAPGQQSHSDSSHHDAPGHFMFHVPFFMENGQAHGYGQNGDFQQHHTQDYESGDSPMMKDDEYNPYFQENSKHEGNQDPSYFSHWPNDFKPPNKEKSKMKGQKMNQGAYMQGHEPDQFDCRCRPFMHDWSRLKRCVQQCGMPYRTRQIQG